MILYELITNAARHGFERGGGEIRVAVWLDGAFVKCSVQGQRIGCASKALGGDLKPTFGPPGSKSLLVFPHDSSPTVIAGETRSGMGRRDVNKVALAVLLAPVDTLMRSHAGNQPRKPHQRPMRDSHPIAGLKGWWWQHDQTAALARA
jgi:two-component sensor histidine kinase